VGVFFGLYKKFIILQNWKRSLLLSISCIILTLEKTKILRIQEHKQLAEDDLVFVLVSLLSLTRQVPLRTKRLSDSDEYP